MCGSMVDIQSPAAEIRRGNKKDRRKKKPQGKNIMSASATQGGRTTNFVMCTGISSKLSLDFRGKSATMSQISHGVIK